MTFHVRPSDRFFFQLPTIELHHSVTTALGLPDLMLVTVRRLDSGRRVALWLVAGRDPYWTGITRPWHRVARISAAGWRALGSNGIEDDIPIEISFPESRMDVRPARIDQPLLGGDEIGLHRDDATRLGVSGWVVAHTSRVPAALRVRISDEPDDMGVARISFQGRVLLGIGPAIPGRNPEIRLSPFPVDASGRPLRTAALRPPRHRVQRFIRTLGYLVDQAAIAVLRAPRLTFRVVEASPGEDQALSARLPSELFPLLGTEPGHQVYLSWGPRNESVVTALVASSEHERFDPPVEVVGPQVPDAPEVPSFAEIRVGAATRAALGIPRVTTVSVRRRVMPLLIGKLNELVLPVTGLFVALSTDVGLRTWQVLVAAVIVLALLFAPLRIRRTPPGRYP